MDYYPLSDLLYRTVALTDSPDEGDVAVVEAYDTDAYGNTLVFDGPGADEEWFTDDDITTKDPICHFIFTGRRYDPATEIYFYRARYYQQVLGRFVSRDPIAYVRGGNLYAAYFAVHGKTDPGGLMEGMPWTPGGAGFPGETRYIDPEALSPLQVDWEKTRENVREAAAAAKRAIQQAGAAACCRAGIISLKDSQSREATFEDFADSARKVAEMMRLLEAVCWYNTGIAWIDLPLAASTPFGLAAEKDAELWESLADKERALQRWICQTAIIPYCCPDEARQYCREYM